MQNQPPNNPPPPGPYGAPDPGGFDFSDTVDDAAGGLKAKWSSFERPVQIGLVIGALVVFAVFARYIIPAMLAAIGIGAVIAILFVPYWLPTVIAFFRGHPNKLAIAVVNFFFGWTFIGWFIALIWAVSNTSGGGNQSVVVNVSNNAQAGMPYPVQPVAGYAPQQVPPPVGQPQQQALPPAAQSPQYRVGDVVNGHRFDGANWVPEAAPNQPPPPPPVQS